VERNLEKVREQHGVEIEAGFVSVAVKHTAQHIWRCSSYLEESLRGLEQMDSFFTEKRVLVTGACGTVGNELVRQLLEECQVG